VSRDPQGGIREGSWGEKLLNGGEAVGGERNNVGGFSRGNSIMEKRSEKNLRTSVWVAKENWDISIKKKMSWNGRHLGEVKQERLGGFG